MLDATYQLNEYRYPVFVMLVEDGFGESEVVCFFFVVDESKDTLLSMLNVFVELNRDGVTNTKVVVSDKDITERELLKQVFPYSQLLICLFHTLKIFKREITCDKMGITSAERENVLLLL